MSPRPAPRAKPSARPRHRYVLFRVVRPVPLGRPALLEALRRAAGGAGATWLTRFDGVHGVLRCPRGSEGDARLLLREGLPRVGVEVETLSTSGTIAALERRHGARLGPRRTE